MELAGAGASLAGLIGLNLTGPARSVAGFTGCAKPAIEQLAVRRPLVGTPDPALLG